MDDVIFISCVRYLEIIQHSRRKMHLLWRALLCLSVLLGECIVALKFSSVTSHVRLGEARGKLAGFADFNADKATDVLVRNSAGQLLIYRRCPTNDVSPLPVT